MALALGPAVGQRQTGLEESVKEAERTVIKLLLNNGEKATLVM